MNIGKEISEKDEYNNHKRLQSIDETRWTAKQTALKRIFGSYDSTDNNGMLTNLIIALTKI